MSTTPESLLPQQPEFNATLVQLPNGMRAIFSTANGGQYVGEFEYQFYNPKVLPHMANLLAQLTAQQASALQVAPANALATLDAGMRKRNGN